MNKDKKIIKGELNLDKTGRCNPAAHSLEILWKGDKILFADYPHSLAHSLWRSQEFSLFMQNKDYLMPPIMDFGCGDGSFASVLFNQINYGVDIDKQALEVAMDYNIYNNIIFVSPDSERHSNVLPVESGIIGSIFSNSVLEHVINLETTISEFYRVLKTDGILMFTVPTIQFKYDLEKYFSKKDSEIINNRFFHRNLLSSMEWIKLIETHGFSIIKIIQYQPDWFSFLYRIMITTGIGRICTKLRKYIWNIFNEYIVKTVKKSISTTELGGNIFVISKKS